MHRPALRPKFKSLTQQVTTHRLRSTLKGKLMRLILLGVGLALAACSGTGVVQPDPVRQQLLATCQAGNTNVCIQLAQLDQAERNRRSSIPLPVYNSNQLNPSDFRNNGAYQMAPQQTTCRPQFGGQVVCQTQ